MLHVSIPALLQINKLVTRAFRNLKADEVLNFSVAVTVMRVQRKWRARMRAAKMKRKKEVRGEAVGDGAASIVGCALLSTVNSHVGCQGFRV